MWSGPKLMSAMSASRMASLASRLSAYPPARLQSRSIHLSRCPSDQVGLKGRLIQARVHPLDPQAPP